MTLVPVSQVVRRLSAWAAGGTYTSGKNLCLKLVNNDIQTDVFTCTGNKDRYGPPCQCSLSEEGVFLALTPPACVGTFTHQGPGAAQGVPRFQPQQIGYIWSRTQPGPDSRIVSLTKPNTDQLNIDQPGEPALHCSDRARTMLKQADLVPVGLCRSFKETLYPEYRSPESLQVTRYGS